MGNNMPSHHAICKFANEQSTLPLAANVSRSKKKQKESNVLVGDLVEVDSMAC